MFERSKCKKVVGPQAKREMVGYLCTARGLSPRRACQLVGLQSSSYYYQSYSSRDDEKLKSRLIEFAHLRVRWGLPRLFVLARREGFMDNYKRVRRIYNEAGLQIQRRKKKKLRGHLKLVLPLPEKPNHIWSMDFVSESLADLRRFRCFNIVDDFTRESVVIEAERSLPSEKLVQILNKLKLTRGLPQMIVCDNGPELISQNLEIWAYQNKVQLKFIEPGKPVQNAYIESFNGRFRDECLNQHWFLNLEDAKHEIELWRKDYNENRPHRSLDMKTPNQFAKEFKMMLTN
jgi:putative transposase